MIRAINIAAAILLAAVVTFSLFFVMQYLISADQTPPERSERRIIGDITIPEVDIQVQRQQPKPQEPDAPEDVPDLPEPRFDSSGGPSSGPAISLSRVDIDMGNLDTGANISSSDQEYLPIVTIAPQYPQRALQRGIEGWCLVSFTVNENGGVEDPMVVDGEPPGMFDSSSLRAVTRFKFNPKVEKGQPVKTHGVQYLFRYNLADED